MTDKQDQLVIIVFRVFTAFRDACTSSRHFGSGNWTFPFDPKPTMCFLLIWIQLLCCNVKTVKLFYKIYLHVYPFLMG